MNAKLKGLFKGLRYISSIFEEEEKEEEIVIGLPTDVKHVAHIGWEGPEATNAESSPSWMKEFPASEGVSQSAQTLGGGSKEKSPQAQVGGTIEHLAQTHIRGTQENSSQAHVGSTKENSKILCDSEDLERKPSKSKSSSRDSPERVKSTKKHPKEQPKDLTENTHAQHTTRRQPKELIQENTQNTNSPKREKPRNSRRRSAKEPSENGSSSNKHLHVQDVTSGPESSPSRNTQEVPKKLRRKKSKENQNQLYGVDSSVSGSGRSSRSKGKRSGTDHGHAEHGHHDLGHAEHGHHDLGHADHKHHDHESSLQSVVSNDSLRSWSKEDKEYRQVVS